MPQLEQRVGVTGGAPIYSFLSNGSVQAAVIKSTIGQVLALHFFNSSASICYVRLYDLSTVPGPGDSPVYRMGIPQNVAGAGFVVPIPPGTPFNNGIGVRVTAGAADNDNTSLSNGAVLGNIFYR
jgi:hypothetical protein